jgi:hypothetical protein
MVIDVLDEMMSLWVVEIGEWWGEMVRVVWIELWRGG